MRSEVRVSTFVEVIELLAEFSGNDGVKVY